MKTHTAVTKTTKMPAKKVSKALKAATAMAEVNMDSIKPEAQAEVKANLEKLVAAKPEPELGNPQGITVVSGATGAVIGKAKAAAKPAAKKAVAKPAPKAAKPEDSTLRLRLYAHGSLYFGKVAAARLNGLPNMHIEIKGKAITLTPTKSEKDTRKIGACHASPTLSMGKLLRDVEWSKKTQDIVAKPVGEAGFQIEVR